MITISDIHGNLNLLNKVLSKFPPEENQYVILGDIIDRGPESSQCVTITRNLVENHNAILLRGNHEIMMFDAMENPDNLMFWLTNGGFSTLESYGLTEELFLKELLSLSKVHQILLDAYWLHTNADDYLFDNDILFAHAAIPKIDFSESVIGEDHFWNRPENGQHDFPKVVNLCVFGHTPMEIAPQQLIFQNGRQEFINTLYIDTGNFRSRTMIAYDTESKIAWTFYEDNDLTEQKEIAWS